VSLSFYVLTHNSEKYLDRILGPVSAVADELVVVDSGSSDRTAAIAKSHGARFVVHPFRDFADQRLFALSQCVHDWVLSLDSDEVPDEDFVEVLRSLKAQDFQTEEGAQAFRVRRYWYALGRKIRAVYPIRCPDAPIRLVRKESAHFRHSSRVHETIEVPGRHVILDKGSIAHHTFETPEEIERKLEHYTDLAALDLRDKGKHGSRMTALAHGSVSFVKWYFLKGSYLDGSAGWRMGRYAFDYVYRKYVKRMRLGEAEGSTPS
jgi:glycosyltransferase involved in cell wall biosynthesis